MIFDRFPLKRGKKDGPQVTEKLPQAPVLSEEDEKFLQNLTSEAVPPPLPERPIVIFDDGSKASTKDEQMASLEGADQIPLPMSPDEDHLRGEGSAEEKDKHRWRSFVGHLPTLPARIFDKKVERKAEKSKEDQTDEDDLTKVLDQLNLAAVDNRVFSFSGESQKLLDEFKLVLKDIVNGVPTAYDDLVKLLTDSENQLQKIFADLPPWLQTLVKSLPAKMTSFLGPEMLAAASEKPGVGSVSMEEGASTSASGKAKKGRLPSLKKMVSQRGAIAAMLQSILQFLKLRFPSFLLGTNVLLSVSVFLLLFVFWYLFKRGRETRLAREAADNQDQISDIEASDPEESASGSLPKEGGSK